MMLFAFLLTLAPSVWGGENFNQMLGYYRSHSLWTDPGEQKTILILLICRRTLRKKEQIHPPDRFSNIGNKKI